MLAAPSIVPGLQAIGYRAPRTIQETPVHYAHNVTLFQWLKENPQERTYFDNYMAGRRKDIVRWYHVYPVKEQLAARLRQEEDAVLLVDVGGSQGHDLAAFKDLFADLPGKLVLEDLPETIHSIPPLNGIETLAYDFYTPQPNKGKALSRSARMTTLTAQVLDCIISAQYAMTGLTNTAFNSFPTPLKQWTSIIRLFLSTTMSSPKWAHLYAQRRWIYR